ncbi:J domain-containing protein [Tautonia plasticadhaerens]|uniref:Chaperone protein DnaJ n=1 Tax=Tautonia plasticadhaerens TaxID=2527974 RepID=A0A518HBR8_9BACT|nr:J domain-containing protein [Tautonia plasticadhaerens]QDV38289.1 Chaperone protein DnaJ [Tautonia plasticadhaerens]
MNYTVEIDPSQVLGVPRDATLEQIRDAYRSRSKKYHPDVGGDEWAFRVVARSYELLSRARVAGRFAVESGEHPAAPVNPVVPKTPEDEGASVRSGVRDRVDHPILLVDVELLLLRVELENPYEVIAIPASKRNLSCTLNVSWPPAVAADAPPGPDPAGVLPRVVEAFGLALKQTRPTSSAQDDGPSAFRGWLSYPSAQESYDAFNRLRQALKGLGLGVSQRIREVIIPRDTA